MTLIISFPIKHLLNYSNSQTLIFHRPIYIFNMLLIYLCFGNKAGGFQAICQQLNWYIFLRLLMYILTSLKALLSYLLTEFWILASSRITTLNHSSHISTIISKARSRMDLICRRFCSRIVFLFSGKLTSRPFVLYLNMPHEFGTHLF